MSETNPPLPKAASGVKVGGLSRQAQKLQAMREKVEQGKTGTKANASASASTFRAKSTFAGKKTNFQRKAV